MKQLLLICLVSCLVVGQAMAQRSLSPMQKKASEASAAGKIDSSIYYYKLASYEYLQNNKLSEFGVCLQNIGFIYDEKLNDTAKTMVYSQLALGAFEAAKDSLGIANILKYIGLQHCKVKEYKLGYQKIDRAIALFTAKKHISGVYVSKYDKALGKYMQGAYKECIAELKSCEEFWKKEDAPFRLAGIYVQMVKAYNKTGNQKLKAEYKAKIEELVKNKQIRAAMYTEDIQKL